VKDPGTRPGDDVGGGKLGVSKIGGLVHRDARERARAAAKSSTNLTESLGERVLTCFEVMHGCADD
jgi:hypothetical protein